MTAKGSCIWAVDSGDTIYTVQQEQERCTQGCALECTQCNICLHMYSCTCYDHLIHSTICKHIHLVVRTVRGEDVPSGPPTHIQQDTTIILEGLRQPTPSSCTSGRQRLFSKLDELRGCILECSTLVGLTAAEKHISAAISVLKAMASQDAPVLPPAPVEPSNKKLTVQRFKSLKKKRKTSKVC